LQAIYFEGKVLQEIVQGRDVSRSWACRVHARALQRFQKLWEELGSELS
jgi:DNA-directed RNA polymerase specialized sigma subunit